MIFANLKEEYRPFVKKSSIAKQKQMVVKRTKSNKLNHLNCRRLGHISNQKGEMLMMKFRILKGRE